MPAAGGKNELPLDPQTGATIHTNVACDVCGAAPIVGLRYKSCSRQDYDLCGGCHAQPEQQQYAPYQQSGRARGNPATSAGAGAHDSGQAAAAAAAAAGGANGIGAWHAPGGSAPKRQKQQQPQQHQGGQPPRKDAQRHQALAEWVWAYFSSADGPADQPAAPAAGSAATGPTGGSSAAAAAASSSKGASACNGGPVNAFVRLAAAAHAAAPVVRTHKPPLYLQHEGHSRTIVGIERTMPVQQQQQGQRQRSPAGGGVNGTNGSTGNCSSAGGDCAVYTLLVLDPGMPSGELLASLRKKDRWQMRVKRGLASLSRHAELQLLYVAPGLVAPGGADWQALKRMAAAEKHA